MHRQIRSFVGLASLCLSLAQMQAASPRVGEFYAAQEGGRSLATRSETIYSGARFVRSDSGGMLHLVNERVLQMSENSAAIFELRGDSVAVRVLAGNVRAVGESGRVLEAGSGSRFAVGPSENYPDEDEALLLGQPSGRRMPRSDELEAARDQPSSRSAISGR